MAYGYGTPLSGLASDAANVAGAIQQMRVRNQAMGLAALQEQRAAEEYAYEQRMRPVLEARQAEIDRRALADWNYKQSENQRIAREREAARAAMGKALGGLQSADVGTYSIVGLPVIQPGGFSAQEMMPEAGSLSPMGLVPSGPQVKQGFVPLRATLAARDAYLSNAAETEMLRGLAPLAASGALDDQSGAILKLVDGLPGQRRKERAALQSEARRTMAEENRAQKALIDARLKEEAEAARQRQFEERMQSIAEIAAANRAGAMERVTVQVNAANERAGAAREDANKRAGYDPNGAPPDVANDPVLRRQAAQFLLTGKFPSNTGRGAGAALNAKIRLAADYLAQERGLSVGEVEAIRADYNADSKSLTAFKKGADSVMGFERGAQNSLAIIERLAQNYQRGKYPAVNRLSQVFAYYSGDPDVKALRNAIQTSMTEYMKVITAGQGVSVAELSVGAQERTKQLLQAFDNPQAMANEINVYRQEMAAKKQAFEETLAGIRSRISTADQLILGAQGAPAPTSLPNTRTKNPAAQAEYDSYRAAFGRIMQNLANNPKERDKQLKALDAKARQMGVIK